MPRLPPQEGLPPPLCIPRWLQRGCTLPCKPDISLANKTGQLDVLPTVVLRFIQRGPKLVVVLRGIQANLSGFPLGSAAFRTAWRLIRAGSFSDKRLRLDGLKACGGLE